MDIPSINVTTLFQWVPKTSDSLSLAIHLLKRSESKLAWKYLGKLFVDFLKSNDRTKINSSNAVLVPVPSRSLSSVHTKYFSSELANNLGIKKVELICHQKTSQELNSALRPQKELSRRQRIDREFDLCVDFTRAGEVENLQNIVLIDDVVTTGATLQACTRQIRALKPNANVCAWVMFKRL